MYFIYTRLFHESYSCGDAFVKIMFTIFDLSTLVMKKAKVCSFPERNNVNKACTVFIAYEIKLRRLLITLDY